MSTQVVKMSARYRRGLSSMLLNTTLHCPFFFTKRLRRRPVPRSKPRWHEGGARQLLWTIGSFVTLRDKAPLLSSLPGHSPPSSPCMQAPDRVCWVRGLWPLWRPKVEIFRASSSVETMLYLGEARRRSRFKRSYYSVNPRVPFLILARALKLSIFTLHRVNGSLKWIQEMIFNCRLQLTVTSILLS